MSSPSPRRDFSWKLFLGELAVYAVLLFIYFQLVLHYWANWLKDVFDHDKRSYATVAILLMVGQAVGLEMVSSILFGLFKLGRK
ncbi:MAG: hypothetical protein LV479_07480 [Methylacidiphilales bacterium]|nr:hypothetical protein [Candidatus Methylacidiphilales bacterium]